MKAAPQRRSVLFGPWRASVSAQARQTGPLDRATDDLRVGVTRIVDRAVDAHPARATAHECIAEGAKSSPRISTCSGRSPRATAAAERRPSFVVPVSASFAKAVASFFAVGAASSFCAAVIGNCSRYPWFSATRAFQSNVMQGDGVARRSSGSGQ